MTDEDDKEDTELLNDSSIVESSSMVGQGVTYIGQGFTSSISHGAQVVASAVLAITAWLLSVILRALPATRTKFSVRNSSPSEQPNLIGSQDFSEVLQSTHTTYMIVY